MGTMKSRCVKCGDDHELMKDSPRVVLHAVDAIGIAY